MDPKDEDGMTPLAYAVACENEEEIELLVRQGGQFWESVTRYKEKWAWI